MPGKSFDVVNDEHKLEKPKLVGTKAEKKKSSPKPKPKENEK